MSSGKSKIDDALKLIGRLFPGAEVLKKDGSREKLSNIFELAADVNERPAKSRQRKGTNQQLSINFEDTGFKGQRGCAHD